MNHPFVYNDLYAKHSFRTNLALISTSQIIIFYSIFVNGTTISIQSVQFYSIIMQIYRRKRINEA